jgi:hypothetical protein
MRVLIVGAPEAADGIAEQLAAAGVEPRTSAPGPEPDGIPALAATLLELERELTDRSPAAVVLADRGDRALAAALVATKLLVPVFAAGTQKSSGSAENERLLGLLAEAAEPADLPTLLSR